MTTELQLRTGVLDTATIILVVTGVLCGNLIGLPPDAQLAQLILIFTGLNTVILVCRERWAVRRRESLRSFHPTRKRMAATGVALLVALALVFFLSLRPGHGWIAFGLALVGAGYSIQFLVESRGPQQTVPGTRIPDEKSRDG